MWSEGQTAVVLGPASQRAQRPPALGPEGAGLQEQVCLFNAGGVLLPPTEGAKPSVLKWG